MSSPPNSRNMRSSKSATPRRTARNSQLLRSSPMPSVGPDAQLLSEANNGAFQRDVTPVNQVDRLQSAGLAAQSSPLFFRSSPVQPSPMNARNGATSRASAMTIGDSSPIRYAPSSSPSRAASRQPQDDFNSNGTLFLRTARASGSQTHARDRRGDLSSDFLRSDAYERLGTTPVGDAPGEDPTTFSNLNPDTSEADALAGAGNRALWGSNILQSQVIRLVRDFLMNFEAKYRMIRDGEIDVNDTLPAGHPARRKEYIEMMKTMLELGVTSLNIDMKNLKAYAPTTKLWYQFQDFPSEVIPMFDESVKEVMLELAANRMTILRDQNQRRTPANSRLRQPSSVPLPPTSEADVPEIREDENLPDLVREIEGKVYRVRPFGLDKTVNLRDLNPGDIDRVVSVKGLVIRTTPVIPDMKDAFFQCAVCNHGIIVEIDRGKIPEPTECSREACKSPNSMQIVHNRSSFADKQIIKLQETPDNVPDGQTPHAVSLCAYDDLVDFCKAGDRVEVTGIFKCNQVRVNPRQRTVKNVYKTFVDVLHIQKVDKKRMGIDTSTIEQELSEQVAAGTEETRRVTEEDEQKIKATAARPDVYDLLSHSLAPSIYEMDDVKKGILLQLFGGTNKSFEKGGNPKYRGDINVLLCGDPSTSKSQLLMYVHKIAPRGVYTSGKGSSAVGLTAYVTRDPETRQLVLESGALVLSDGGVCCIDEFDKMSESTRSVLHEVMEQQTVSIAKAGIITTLNARTSILASANPIGSKYNVNLPVPQNIDLPPTLLSRFDLVYLVLDRIEEQNDRRLARHLMGMYLEDTPDNASSSSEILPIEFLTSYISYARAKCQPKITQEASDELVQAYVTMRKLGEDVRAAERRITATTRQLESMIRLAEAHAKMRLSDFVTRDDVVEAVRLIKSALKQAATDSRTGLIDMSLLTEGTSASERRRKTDLKNAILALLDEMTAQGGNVRYGELAKRLAEQSSGPVDADEVNVAIRTLQQEGSLQIVGEGARRSIRRFTGM